MADRKRPAAVLFDRDGTPIVNVRGELPGGGAPWAVRRLGGVLTQRGRRMRVSQTRTGLILRAAAILNVSARDRVVIGDIGRDMEAAQAAGAICTHQKLSR